MTHHIFFVDPEPENLYLLEQICGNEVQITYSPSGEAALELLRGDHAGIIISAQRLSDIPAIEFLEKAAEICPDAVRILTGESETETLIEAINSGVVHKYFAKPWIKSDIEQTIARFLEGSLCNNQSRSLAVRDIQTSGNPAENLTFLIPLSTAAKNSEAGLREARASRIGMYAAAIGQRLELPVTEIEKLTLAAFYSERQATARTTPKGYLPHLEETTAFQTSEAINAFFPPETPDIIELTSVIRHIGEHFDGSGFPDALAGCQIPLHSRVIAVAKAYDKAISAFNISHPGAHYHALSKLKKGAGTLFDPAIVSSFCGIEPIGHIRQLLCCGFNGVRRLSVRIFCDTGEVNFTEMLDKIKTTPMMAIETLYLANELDADSPTAQLMVAANKLGEAGLRQMMSEYGFPLSDPRMKIWVETSLRRACAAQILAAYTDIINPDIAYTLGLLADIGEILLSEVYPSEMRELRKINDDRMRFYREVEIFGVESTQVSRWLLEDCGIKPNLTAAINVRHKSLQNNDPLSFLLDIADEIAGAREENNTNIFANLNQTQLDILRLSRRDLDKIYNQTIAFSAELIKSHAEIYKFVEIALI